MPISLAHIFSWIVTYGYFIILPVAIIEGPIITVIAAFLASQGYFNVFIVYPVGVAGDVIGDFLYYLVGKYAKRFLVKHPKSKFLGITEERITKLEHHFDRNSTKTLLFGKWTHSMGFATLLSAGAAEMPAGKFIWITFLGTVPKSLVFVLIGYFLGSAYQSINSYLGKTSLILFFVLLVGGMMYVYTSSKKSTI